MSMFDLVFQDPNRQQRMGILLAALAYTRDSRDGEEALAWVRPILNLRLRDSWVEKDHDGPPLLAVYTRNGGGNREHFHEDGDGGCIACAGEAATRHPAYLRDRDDEFDSTYRTYWFAFPADLPTDMKETLVEVAEEPRNMSKIWLAAIDAIGSEA